ncbi:hypothetical protein HNV12_12205 [Methanococcoides sp. SA1]|nr:hypothetical protein [Methanococcoides sp. SA1]
MEPIKVKGLRILGPFESDKLVASIEKDYLRDILSFAPGPVCDTSLITKYIKDVIWLKQCSQC